MHGATLGLPNYYKETISTMKSLARASPIQIRWLLQATNASC